MYKSKYLEKIRAKDLPYTPSKDTVGLDDPVKIKSQAEPKKVEYQKKSRNDYGFSAGACMTASSYYATGCPERYTSPNAAQLRRKTFGITK